MSELDRRAFLKTVAAAVPAVAAGTASACAPEGARGAGSLDHATLLALGQVVLPGELGADGTAHAVAGFETWVAGYRPAVEATHGYGTGSIEYTPAHPGPGWAAQLEALDLEARERYGKPFPSLGTDERREMVRGQLTRERVDRLPNPAQARHVAVGLLAYWAQTPEATNLCYEAAINPYACRPLAAQASKPASLPGS